MAELPYSELEGLISVKYEGRSLQMRRDQLTVEVVSKVFRLIPQTVLLVSDVGTIATADEGVFNNVDAVYTWTVEGDKATGFQGNGSIRCCWSESDAKASKFAAEAKAGSE